MNAIVLAIDFPEVQPGYEEGRKLIDGRSIDDINVKKNSEPETPELIIENP